MSYPVALAADLAAGVVAGLAAAAAMDLFQRGWTMVAKPPGHGKPATEKAADAIFETLSGKAVKKSARGTASQAVHYATGAVMGALYGVVSGMIPAITAGGGLLYGSTTWLVADEIAVPALGLGPPPDRTPAQAHGYALASHLVFGAVLDITRRMLNRAIAPR